MMRKYWFSRMRDSRLFKIGKKFWFPDVPSSWVSRTVDYIEHYQDHRPKNQILKIGMDMEGVKPYPYSSMLPSLRWYWLRDHTVMDGYAWCFRNVYHVDEFLDDQDRDGDGDGDGDADSDSDIIKEGEPLPFDLMSLLCGEREGEGEGEGEEEMKRGYLVRKDGLKVEVDTLRGKNILVCCFNVPLFWLEEETDAIRGMITAYSNLPNPSDYEMVMVARMRRNWIQDEDAFNHFFSAFPSSWLAVPFSDTLRCDKICSSLCLSSDPLGLLVDHHQKVVVHSALFRNGLEFPPFCERYCSTWWKSHTKLHSILESEFLFKIKNNYATTRIDQDNKVSISQLEDKLVGLYMCYDGSLIRTLSLMSQECNARGQEFHIVLVYLPYRESVDPLLFQEAINHVVLCKLEEVSANPNPNWWVSPFNDFVSRKLLQVHLENYRYNRSTEDELVILDPKMNIADHLGKYVVNRLGINGYPFTRKSLVLRELEAIRAVTLESLLVYGSRDYVLNMNNDQVPVGELRGKHVLVYIDKVETPSDTYDTLLKWYNRNKTARVADFEVVFVHFDGEATTSFGSPKPIMLWLVCPFDPQHTDFVKEKILKAGTKKGILAAFDKDGLLITLFAKDLLDSFGPEGFPSYNGLHNEMVLHVELEHLLEMDDVFDNDGPLRASCLSSPSSQHTLYS